MSQIISTTEAPKAIGAYSQAIRAGAMTFLSGQIAIDPATGEVPDDIKADVAAQARRVMQNLLAIVKAAGHTRDEICKCTIYLRTMDDFGAVNAVYQEALGDHRPARATVAVAGLPRNVLVEIDAICAAG